MAGASRKEYELLMRLTAALGPGFNSTFQTAMNTTKKLQDTLQSVKKVQSDISGYTKTQEAIAATKAKIADYTNKHNTLQKELSQTLTKEKELQAAVNQAKQNQAAAKDIDTYKKLTAEHDKLQKELEQTTTKKNTLERQIEANTAATDRARLKIAQQEKSLADLSKELQAAGVNTGKLTDENAKLEKAYERVKASQENIARVNQAIEQNKQAISATKAELTKAVGTVAAFGAAFAVPIKGAMEFESSMAEVAKVVDWIGNGNNATAEQIQQYNELSDGLYKLTREIPMTVKEFAEITAAAGQANVARDNAGLLQFASDAAKMGIAFDISAEQAGDFMAKWRTSFKMTQKEVTALSDVINFLGNSTPATAAQISNVVTRIGPLGEVAGLSSKELAALGATIVGVGINEDVAATGIKNLMLDMTKGTATTKKMESVLAKLGTSSTDLANRMQTDAKGAILDFMRAVQQLPAAEQAAALNTYFGEQSVAAIAPLLSNLEFLEEQFYKVGDASQYAGSMEAEYAARAATSEFTLETLKNAVKELSDTFGKIFVPGAESGMQAITQLIWKATDFIKANPDLIKTLTKVAAGFQGLRIAGLSGKLGFEYFSLGSNMAKKALELFKGKAAESTAEALTGSSKLTQLGKSLTGYFNGVRNSLGGVGNSINALTDGKTTGFASSIISSFGSLGGKINSLLSPIGSNITGFFGKIGGTIANGPLGKIGGMLSSGLGKLGGVFKSLGGAGSALLKPLGGLSGMFGGLFGKIMPIIAIVSLLATAFIKLSGGDISSFIEPLQAAFEAIKPTLTAVMEQLRTLGENLMPLLMTAAEQLAPLFFEIVEAILPVAASLLQAIMPIITAIAENVLPVLMNALGVLMPVLTNLITSILPVIKVLIDAIVPVITVLAEVFSSVLGAAIKAITPIIENIVKVFQGIITFITGVFTGNWTQAWEGIKNIFGGIFGGLVELVKAPFRLIVGVVNGVIGGLNKLKVPDWIPGIGGKGINIPLIPEFAKGTDYTPDTFIAGERGAELITNAKGRKVFTAAQTSGILDNLNALRGVIPFHNPDNAPIPNISKLKEGATTGASMGDIFKNLQSTLSARKIESFNEPPISVANSYSDAPITVNYYATFQIDGNAPSDLEEKFRKSNEHLLDMLEERLRRRADNERRMAYT